MKPLVFLDWHGTLSNCYLWHSFQDGSPKERYLRERITKELFEDQEEYVQAWMRGEVDSESFVHDVAELLEEDERVLWFRFVDDCKTAGYEDLSYLDAIRDLRRHAKVILATDNGEHFRRFIVPRLGLEEIFDDILISAGLMVTKKHPEKFFETYLEEVQAGRALLVDDSRGGCERFVDLGGQAIHVNEEVSTHRALSDALKWVQSTQYAK